MKTRDAFAFRDFDGARILQRPYFKEWREKYRVGTDKTDSELLDDVGKTLSDKNLPRDSLMRGHVLQVVLDEMDALAKCVTAYQRHLKRHVDGLTKYTNSVANKIAAADETADVATLRARHRRATKLAEKYKNFVDCVDALKKKIREQHKAVDNEVGYRYRKAFGERLRQARLEKGLTQAQLGERLQVTQRTVSDYEVSTREPNFAQLARIAYKLDKPVGWFLEQFGR